jgi:hypothetical protein
MLRLLHDVPSLKQIRKIQKYFLITTDNERDINSHHILQKEIIFVCYIEQITLMTADFIDNVLFTVGSTNLPLHRLNSVCNKILGNSKKTSFLNIQTSICLVT